MTSALDRTIERAEEQLRALYTARAEAEAAQERVKSFGRDEFEDGAVILFDYQFNEGGTTYSYAAIKARGAWYSTGPNAPKAFSWDSMCAWWARALNNVEIWYVDTIKPK